MFLAAFSAVIRSLQLLFLLVLFGLGSAYYDDDSIGDPRVTYLLILLIITILYVVLTYVLYTLKKNIGIVLSIGESVLTFLWLLAFSLILDLALKLGVCSFHVSVLDVKYLFSFNWCKICKAMVPFALFDFLLFAIGSVALVVLKIRANKTDEGAKCDDQLGKFISRLFFGKSKEPEDFENKPTYKSNCNLQEHNSFINLEGQNQNVNRKINLSEIITGVDSEKVNKQNPDEIKVSDFEPLIKNTESVSEFANPMGEIFNSKIDLLSEKNEFPHESYKSTTDEINFNANSSIRENQQQTPDDCINTNLFSQNKLNA